MTAPDPAPLPGRPRSVVICDDRAQIRNSLRQVLGQCTDITLVGEAWDLDTCADQVRQHRPDLLILDVNIPGGGGIDAARSAKTISPGTMIVAYSGRQEQAVIDAMMSAGSDYFVLKTGRIKPLLDALRSAPPAGTAADAPAADRPP